MKSECHFYVVDGGGISGIDSWASVYLSSKLCFRKLKNHERAILIYRRNRFDGFASSARYKASAEWPT